jgi:transcriptional regulator with XRE-family HTH domain
MSFGTKLKELREKKGLSQIEFAKLTNLTRSAISMYELEKREPNLNTLITFAKFFNVDINTLLEFNNIIELSADEKELIKKYRQLPSDRKETVKLILDNQVNAVIQKEEEKLRNA